MALVLAALPSGRVRASVRAAPAANVRDLRDYFASCFQPPSVARNTRVTFYFSLDARGAAIGQPRTTWLGFAGGAAERQRELSAFRRSFDMCLPVALDRRMAATIPGEVYFLQFVVGPDGRDQQVLFRPFGSHGGVGGGVMLPGGEPLGPGEPESPQPAIRRFRAFRPQPMRTFRPPIALPRPGQRGLTFH